MPKNLYQIQNKFRDEPRPRGGLLRCREFVMKDAYSFDADETLARQSYEAMRVAYCKIFDRMGLSYRMVSADSARWAGRAAPSSRCSSRAARTSSGRARSASTPRT